MLNKPEQDPIEAYLDEVCAAMQVPHMYEFLAGSWQDKIGIEVTKSDMESILGNVMKPVVTRIQAESGTTRDEIKEHLTALITDMRNQGFTHDDSIRRAIAQFGEPKALGRKLGNAILLEIARQDEPYPDTPKKENRKLKFLRIVQPYCIGTLFLASTFFRDAKISPMAIIYPTVVAVYGFVIGYFADHSRDYFSEFSQGRITVLTRKPMYDSSWRQRVWRKLSLLFYYSSHPRLQWLWTVIQAAVATELWFAARTRPNVYICFIMLCLLLAQRIGQIFGELAYRRKAEAA